MPDRGRSEWHSLAAFEQACRLGQCPLHGRHSVLRPAQRARIGRRRRQIKLPDRLDSFSITPKNLESALWKQKGLAVRFASSALGIAGQWVALAAFPAALLGLKWHVSLILAVVLGAVGWHLMTRDQGSFKGCETVADAAGRISKQNYGKLVEKGARLDPPSVWRALCNALSWHGHCPADEIGPGTLLIHP